MDKNQKLRDSAHKSFSYRLRQYDRVGIIGAGPAGSLFAYFLLRLARQEGLQLQVTLYDPRDFTQPGPAGCNTCAGVINGSLQQRLKRIGIDLDQAENLCQSRLHGYLWNTSAGCLRIDVPKGWQPSCTVFRGNGPRFGNLDKNVSFDLYLLQHALEEGARYQQTQVREVTRPDWKDTPVRLTLQENQQLWQEEAELVVGAFGLNPIMMKHFEQLGIGYKPPLCVQAAQLELVRRQNVKPHPVDNYIRVYNINGRQRQQLMLTPKGKYATLTLLAPYDLDAEDLHKMRETDEVKNIIISGWDWPEQHCYCVPLLQKRCAKNFYGDRVVLIGDAACCRYYKNGLETALRSAEFAAEAALHHGISRRDFRQWYLPRTAREIKHDNLFGRFLLYVHNIITSHPFLTRLFIQIRDEMTRPNIARKHGDILWDMLTGNRPYRHIFYRIVHPSLLLEICTHLGQVMERNLTKRIAQWGRIFVPAKHRQQKERTNLKFHHSARKTQPGPMDYPRGRDYAGGTHSSFRVSIIGGGPAGSSCAIALMQLAHQQSIKLEVTIHEQKDFAAAVATYHPSGVPYYDKRINQCIGVLSPPIYEILTQKLKIKFPDHLVQKYIVGYALHGRHQTINLDEPYGSSYALRRITFDDYMMSQALQHHARLNLDKVVQIERTGRTLTVSTTGGTVEADVVVGAFGVEQNVADIFERCFGYRRPEYMQTIITKRHPAPDFLRKFGLRIHVFLPALPAVEFGAITPKYNHLSINIAGSAVDKNTMYDFLALPQVAQLLPQDYDEKGSEIFYPGCFPTSPADNIFADRMVVIGDASGMIRPFKGKGVNSAILGGIAAARVIVHRGLSAHSFQHYYLPLFRQVSEDILYARTARLLTNLLANYGGMDLVLLMAKESPMLQRALTEAVSGACSYKTIMHRLTNERILWRAGSLLLKKFSADYL